MSLRAPIVYCLPEDTACVARAAFPKGNAYPAVADALGPIYTNPQFADLSSPRRASRPSPPRSWRW